VVRLDMLQKSIEFHVFCYMLRVASPEIGHVHPGAQLVGS
jgi:hypothetical protein